MPSLRFIISTLLVASALNLALMVPGGFVKTLWPPRHAIIRHPQTSCPYPAKTMIAAQLFFGRDIPGREPVTEAEWSEFVSQTLARQFPDGFTVLDGAGNWRDGKTGKVISEPSKIVLIAAGSAPDMDRRLDAVIAAYRGRFQQQAVGMLRSTACGAF